MKGKSSLVAGLLVIGISGAAFAYPGYHHQAVDSSQWLSIPAIHERVVAAGYADITSVKRAPYGYWVKAKQADGTMAILRVDPVSGEITDVKIKDKKACDKRSTPGAVESE
jgi:hypothetical protein